MSLLLFSNWGWSVFNQPAIWFSCTHAEHNTGCCRRAALASHRSFRVHHMGACPDGSSWRSMHDHYKLMLKLIKVSTCKLWPENRTGDLYVCEVELEQHTDSHGIEFWSQTLHGFLPECWCMFRCPAFCVSCPGQKNQDLTGALCAEACHLISNINQHCSYLYYHLPPS